MKIKLNLYTFLFSSFLVAQEITYTDGKRYMTYSNENTEISVNLSKDRQYGKYYILDIGIFNYTDQTYDFNPSEITGHIVRKDKIKRAEVLSHKEFMKKVKSRQTWAAVSKAIGEHSDASQAGVSTTNTISDTYGSYSGRSNTNYSNNYGEYTGSSISTGTVSGYSTTNSESTTIDNSAKYMATQNANRNVQQFQREQSKMSNMLNEGYLKRNTLRSQNYIRGNVNIKYSKADKIRIVVPVNGEDYIFMWEKDLIDDID